MENFYKSQKTLNIKWKTLDKMWKGLYKNGKFSIKRVLRFHPARDEVAMPH